MTIQEQDFRAMTEEQQQITQEAYDRTSEIETKVPNDCLGAIEQYSVRTTPVGRLFCNAETTPILVLEALKDAPYHEIQAAVFVFATCCDPMIGQIVPWLMTQNSDLEDKISKMAAEQFRDVDQYLAQSYLNLVIKRNLEEM